MKKILAITALSLIFLGLECKPPDEGNFSVVPVGDTVYTVDSIGMSHNFEFTLKNNTAADLPLIVDCPTSMQTLPEGWYISYCDTLNCYPLPCSTMVLKASDSILGSHLTVGTMTAGTEGKIVLTVASGEEVDSQAFILKIAE
ncbi:hypothetical protein GX441_01410 [bacterium]|nr:hypothetical protein [bacterium]